MTFDEWWVMNKNNVMHVRMQDAARAVWVASASAECERCQHLAAKAIADTVQQPLTEAQIQELCCAVDASGVRPAATALIRAVERAHGIGA
jgi:hypothetical protein